MPELTKISNTGTG